MAGNERSNSQQQGRNQQATKPSPASSNYHQKRDDRQYIEPGPEFRKYLEQMRYQSRIGQEQSKPSAPNRTIPQDVKLYVWQRDRGRCVECGSKEKLEYDHIIPFSKGGSNTARNVQLLCEHCNRKKHAKIM
jgi:5-methylcytosine-specific restriction endonuclease McrA